MAEEVLFEVEAVQAVYDSDCQVIQEFPPHLNVHIKPRTADDSSRQFVEAVLGIRAGFQYPTEPPQIEILDSKGLDEKRQAHLVTSVEGKAQELSSCLMLVALCEEAVEALSNMNHPDGNCPLCLYPLVTEDRHNNFLPFMKLMSCFHCFHSECIMRWWKWLQEQNESMPNNLGLHDSTRKCLRSCPVCRKLFHSKDIEHVIGLLETDSSQLSLEGTDNSDNEKEFLQSKTENSRRQKFEALLKVQQENSGLIEPKRNNVLLPGMFLPEPVSIPTTSTNATLEQQDEQKDTSSSSNNPRIIEHKNFNTRKKNRVNYPRKQLNAQSIRKQWIKKEKGASD
ncbi:RWD domain-containing protein isoform X2 [Tasmannia lanceolata]|uniref:RWD domain-containing protein isoform X2 n=1 Tax=Tasmannia lanceolata TaxID=3420 RepID=UPI004063353C